MFSFCFSLVPPQSTNHAEDNVVLTQETGNHKSLHSAMCISHSPVGNVCTNTMLSKKRHFHEVVVSFGEENNI